MQKVKTASRVPARSDARTSKRIRVEADQRIENLKHQDRESILARLHEIDDEWDIERAVEAISGAVTALGLGLGATSDKRWYLLSLSSSLFLVYHALQGWCPPVPPLRRMGYRTPREIEDERHSLLTLLHGT